MAKKSNHNIGIKLIAYPTVLSFYYNWLIEEKKSESTIRSYINIITKFINHFYVFGAPDDFYTEITPEDICEYLESLRAKSGGESGTATNVAKATAWSALNSFFQYLTPSYIKENPLATVKRPYVDKKPKQSNVPKLAKQILFDTPIEKLNLSQRAYSGLIESEILTIGSLCKLSSADLINLGVSRRLIGKKALDEIEKKLSEVGLSLRDSSPIASEKTIDMKLEVHDWAKKWLNWFLSEDNNKLEVFKDKKPFGLLFCELRYQIGLFPDGEKLPDHVIKELFLNSDDWHSVVRFSEILNTITDYKIVAFIVLYKIKTVQFKLTLPHCRDFFIIGFERMICLTEH